MVLVDVSDGHAISTKLWIPMKYFRCKYNITKYTTLTQSILANRYAGRIQKFSISIPKEEFFTIQILDSDV